MNKFKILQQTQYKTLTLVGFAWLWLDPTPRTPKPSASISTVGDGAGDATVVLVCSIWAPGVDMVWCGVGVGVGWCESSIEGLLCSHANHEVFVQLWIQRPCLFGQRDHHMHGRCCSLVLCQPVATLEAANRFCWFDLQIINTNLHVSSFCIARALSSIELLRLEL